MFIKRFENTQVQVISSSQTDLQVSETWLTAYQCPAGDPCGVQAKYVSVLLCELCGNVGHRSSEVISITGLRDTPITKIVS